MKEAFRPSPSTYSPIEYPVAVVRDAGQPALARAFLDRLVGPEGQKVLAGYGFQPPGAPR